MNGRSTVRLAQGWLFHAGDIDAPIPNTHLGAYMANKAGYARGAARPGFDDSDWQQVSIPHDWSVGGPLSPDHHMNAGFRPRGIGWYRRHMRLDPSLRGKALSLHFGGVSSHCTVFVNGHTLHRNFCGYTSFDIDITDVARFGDDLTTIAVRVDATPMEGWWYEGAGIYRHVWLDVRSPVHMPRNGLFCRAVKTEAGWEALVDVAVRNCGAAPAEASVSVDILDTSGTVVSTSTADVGAAPLSAGRAALRCDVTSPALWSIEAPVLYAARARLSVAGEVVDEATVRFGFRTIRFDAQRGFHLNDLPTRLKGVCLHQDHAGVGVAVPDSLWRFRLRQIKTMGANAVRCAHHPPAEEFLEACDELGVLVMNENRNFGSSPEHLRQLEAMVVRDRNHPSVILWSLCNEEPIQTTEVSTRIAHTAARAVRELDPTRPVTAAISGGLLNDNSMAEAVDVMSINYLLHQHDAFHEKHPGLPVIWAETGCTFGTRGVYETGGFHFDARDTAHAPWGATARATLAHLRERPWIAGQFVWSGIDYRGEPSPHGWPCVTSHWGLLDLCGFEKDAAHLHRAAWDDRPMVHLLPHWTWPGREGGTIEVWAYSNADEIELLINGRSLGRREPSMLTATWSVAWEPGVIEAIAYRNGREAARDRVETAGQAVALRAEVHPSSGADPASADGQWAVAVTVTAVDSAGRLVPTADHAVSVSVKGPARVIGVGNGDPASGEADIGACRKLFGGMMQAIIQCTDQPGSVTVTAGAVGLSGGAVTFHAHAAASVNDDRVLTVVRRPTYVTGWRMSRITADRPDPTVVIADSDMNTWERVEPSPAGQSAWQAGGGYAMYRATFSLPRAMQSAGGVLRLDGVAGAVEAYVDGQPVDAAGRIPPGSAKKTVTLVVRASAPPAGLIGTVEVASVTG